jgi:hypothetical protein
VSIALADAPPVEEQAVVWLQAPTAFADIRVPLLAGGAAGATAFAGTTTFATPRLTWHRDVDRDTAGHQDIGTISWESGDLVERGTFPFFGAPVPYVEVWRREPSAGPVLALEAPGGRLVRVGGHSITVVDQRAEGGAFAACHRTLGPSGWEVVSGLGPACNLLPTPPPGEAWEPGDVVGLRRNGAGASWVVVEVSDAAPPLEVRP